MSSSPLLSARLELTLLFFRLIRKPAGAAKAASVIANFNAMLKAKSSSRTTENDLSTDSARRRDPDATDFHVSLPCRHRGSFADIFLPSVGDHLHQRLPSEGEVEGHEQGDDGSGPFPSSRPSRPPFMSLTFFLLQLVESTGASITNKGVFYEPGKEPGPDELPKLHLLIESNDEFRVSPSAAPPRNRSNQLTLFPVRSNTPSPKLSVP